MKPLLLFLVLSIALALQACGYHVAGTTNMLPTTIHTIAVPPFTNATVNNDLARYLTDDVTRELIARTKYKVVPATGGADAILYGSVANTFSLATTIDPATGRSTASLVIVVLQVRLVDRSGKVLYNRPNMDVRDRYEISTVPSQYFDESQVAYQRLARSAAQTIVSGILENF